MELKRFKSTLPPRQRDALRCFSRFFCPFFNWEVIRDCTTFLFLFIFFLFHIFHFCFLFFPRFPSTYSKRVVSNSEHIQRVNWSAPKHTDPLTSFYDWTSEKKTTENRKIYPPHPSDTVKPFQKIKTTQHFPVLFLCVLIRTPFEEKKKKAKDAPCRVWRLQSQKRFFSDQEGELHHGSCSAASLVCFLLVETHFLIKIYKRAV